MPSQPGLPNVDVESVSTLKTSTSVRVQPLGNPPSVVAVTAPPSVPIFYRHRALVALQGTPSNLSLRADWFSPFQRFIQGNLSSRYQRAVGTESFTALITAASPFWFNNSQRCFSVVTLDGVSDWAVLKKDALQVYAGPSLVLGTYSVPRRILRLLAKQLDVARKPTGLHLWLRLGYTFLSGRGMACLSGNGAMYTSLIAEGEEVSVSRKHLVALTVNGPHDLENSVVEFAHTKDTPAPAVPALSSVKTWSLFVAYTRAVAAVLRRYTNKVRGYVNHQTDFVRVVGPRTLLLQSGSGETFTSVPEIMNSGAKPEKTLDDYLNYVTAGEAGVLIESTKSFATSK